MIQRYIYWISENQVKATNEVTIHSFPSEVVKSARLDTVWIYHHKWSDAGTLIFLEILS